MHFSQKHAFSQKYAFLQNMLFYKNMHFNKNMHFSVRIERTQELSCEKPQTQSPNLNKIIITVQ